MGITKLTKENFNDEVMKAGIPVLIDFHADWCGPCRMLSPTVDELAEEYDAFKVCKVNVDEEPELAQAFEVSVIPTIAAVKDGALIGKTTGVVSKQALLELVQA